MVASLLWLYRGSGPDQPPPPAGERPWEIRILADGTSRVFGLTPGRSTLADAMGRFGKGLEAAMFESRGRPLALEAYYSEVVVGGITGRLILSLAPSPAVLQGLRERSPGAKRLGTGAIRYPIDFRDAEVLPSLTVRGLTLVPSANLDEATVQARFGDPVERIPAGEGASRWLYPDRGVAVTISEQGKDLIDYAAPSDFAWLREVYATPE
jgi:hypothetical protein